MNFTAMKFVASLLPSPRIMYHLGTITNCVEKNFNVGGLMMVVTRATCACAMFHCFVSTSAKKLSYRTTYWLVYLQVVFFHVYLYLFCDGEMMRSF